MKQVMRGAITDLEQKTAQLSRNVMGGGIPLALFGARKGLLWIGNGGGHYRSLELLWLKSERFTGILRNSWSVVNR